MSRVSVKISIRVSNRRNSRCMLSPGKVRQSTEYDMPVSKGNSVETGFPIQLTENHQSLSQTFNSTSKEWNMAQLSDRNVQLSPFLEGLLSEVKQIALSENQDANQIEQEFLSAVEQQNYDVLGKMVLKVCQKYPDNHGKCSHYVWNFLRTYIDTVGAQFEKADSLVFQLLDQINSDILIKTLTYAEDSDLIDFVFFNLPSNNKFNHILYALLESSSTTEEKKAQLLSAIASFPSGYKYCMYFEWLLKEGRMQKEKVIDLFIGNYMSISEESQAKISNQMSDNVLCSIVSYSADRGFYRVIDHLLIGMSSSKLGVFVRSILNNGIERKVDKGFFFDHVEEDEELLERIFPKEKLSPLVYYQLQTEAFPRKEPGFIDHVTGYFKYMGTYLSEHLDEYIAGFIMGTLEAIPFIDLINKIQTYISGISQMVSNFLEDPIDVFKKMGSAFYDNFLNIKKFLSIDKKPYQAAKDSVGFLWTVLVARFPGLPKSLAQKMGNLKPGNRKVKDNGTNSLQGRKQESKVNKTHNLKQRAAFHLTSLGNKINDLYGKVCLLHIKQFNLKQDLLRFDAVSLQRLKKIGNDTKDKLKDAFSEIGNKVSDFGQSFGDTSKFSLPSYRSAAKNFWNENVLGKLREASIVWQDWQNVVSENPKKYFKKKFTDGGKSVLQSGKDYFEAKRDFLRKDNLKDEFSKALKFDDPITMTLEERKKAGRTLVKDLAEDKMDKTIFDSQRTTLDLFGKDVGSVMKDPQLLSEFEKNLNTHPDALSHLFYFKIYKKYAKVVIANGDSPLSMLEILSALLVVDSLKQEEDSK